jgi:hypothetical protein
MAVSPLFGRIWDHAIDALERVLGETPVRIRSLGGMVPGSQFIEELGFPAMMIPIVNFDNNHLRM